MARLKLCDLPEVFVPFETVRATQGKVVFYNHNLACNLSESALLSRYTYVTADSALAVDRAAEKKIFLAERYGGDGILTNGGGGRCGYDGLFHLKGLGANQLVGARPRDSYGNSHGNGYLSLDVAVYESVWGEIINIALPYGAVRTAAVIDLEVDFEEPDQTHPRGLLVRMPAVRPAHFIRAVYFKEKKHGDLSEDAKRVKLAVRKLASFLPAPDAEEHVGSVEQRLQSGMQELAKRYAHQFAAARAKRIFHQSISASNVTLDGAWMDLAGATVFSNAMWWDGFNIHTFMNEYSPAMESLHALCFYLSKYKVVSSACSDSILTASVDVFTREYERQLYVYTALQVGFPWGVIQAVCDDPVFIEFSRVLQKVLVHDRFSLTPVINDSGWKGHEHYVARLYRQLLIQKFSNVPQDLAWFCKDTSLMERVSAAYGRLVELALTQSGVGTITRDHLAAYMAISTIRLNRVSDLLLNVREAITQVRLQSRVNGGCFSYGELSESAVRDARLAYSGCSAFETTVWNTHDAVIYYEGLSGNFVVVDRGGSQSVCRKFIDVAEKVKDKTALLMFYGEVKEFFHE